LCGWLDKFQLPALLLLEARRIRTRHISNYGVAAHRRLNL
jgi:hypothetical protein